MNTELAWAAGFFDGEGGTYSWHSKPAGAGMSLQVSQNHCDPLERFATAVGGGKIRQVVRKSTDQEHYIYEVAGLANVQSVLGKLWPYLGEIKRTQAIEAVRRWVEAPRTNRFRGSLLTI